MDVSEKVERWTQLWGERDGEFAGVLEDAFSMRAAASKRPLTLRGTASPTQHSLLRYRPAAAWGMILTNLAWNALDAMKTSPQRELHVETGNDGTADFLRLSDTGEGIDPKWIDAFGAG